jgi:PAS domain S-box-containing protein
MCALTLLSPVAALGLPVEGAPRPLVVVGDDDYRPLTYLDAGKPSGLDVEVAQALGPLLGRPVQIDLLDWQVAQAKVRSGEADVLLGISVTEERKAAFDFTSAVSEHEFGLFFRAGELLPLDGLAGRRVGVTRAGYPRTVLERTPGVTVVPVEGYRDGFDRLLAGGIDAFACDLWVGMESLRSNHLSGIVTSGQPIARQPYALAVRKGDRALLEALERALARARREGTLSRITARWRPREMVFAPRQQVRTAIGIAAGAVGLLLFGVMGLWITALKRHARAQRRVEAALRESEERLRVAIATFPDAIVMTRADGVVTDVNDGFTRIYGWRADEIVGRQSTDVGLWTDLAQRSRFLEAVLTTGGAQDFEATIRTRTGETLDVVLSGRAVSFQGQRYVFGISRDVTSHRRAEAEREAALRQLEALRSQLEQENLYLKEEFEQGARPAGIVGESDGIRYVLARVAQVAPSDTTVLVQGETGVGKELIARAIHAASRRAGAAFVRVNAAALPASIVESELFGHEAGAFTGATRQRKGRFELAHGGTLFLDEIGELPLELQAKLLRVLQEGELERVGSSETLRVDVRVIAATNRDLPAEVAAGRFRPDLFYRLNVFPVTVPPLRARRQDVPLLVRHLLPELAARVGRPIHEVPGGVLRALCDYDWPGNVRELRNVLERCVLQSSDGVLRLAERLEPAREGPPRTAGPRPLRHADAERVHIRGILELTKGRINGPGGAAELLGMNPNTLRSRMKRLGIPSIRPVKTKPGADAH